MCVVEKPEEQYRVMLQVRGRGEGAKEQCGEGLPRGSPWGFGHRRGRGRLSLAGVGGAARIKVGASS